MKTREELKQEYEDELAALEREEAIRATLPVSGAIEPAFIHFVDKKRPWVSYKVKTIEDAATILEAFGPLRSVSAIERGCVSLQPLGEHSDEYAEGKVRFVVLDCVELSQHGGKGFYTAEVRAYPIELNVKLCIEVKDFPYQFRSHMNARYDCYGNVTQAEFIERPELVKDERLKYGGGMRDAFDLRYFYAGVERFRAAFKKEAACQSPA